MNLLLSRVVVLACPLVVLGCPEDPVAGPGSATTVTSTVVPTASTASLPADAVGKPTCDGYLTKMRACIDKLPEAEREGKKKVLDATLAAWREQAVRPEMQANLETSCKAASAALDADPLCK